MKRVPEFILRDWFYQSQSSLKVSSVFLNHQVNVPSVNCWFPWTKSNFLKEILCYVAWPEIAWVYAFFCHNLFEQNFVAASDYLRWQKHSDLVIPHFIQKYAQVIVLEMPCCSVWSWSKNMEGSVVWTRYVYFDSFKNCSRHYRWKYRSISWKNT